MREPMSGTAAHVQIAAIAGSVRAGSWARSLLRASLDRLPSNAGLTIWDGLEAVPPFNEDLESGPAPSAVADMRQLIQESEALLIVTPEYNRSVPGVLKNALDWASRPYGQSVLIDKPVAVVGTSPLPTGAASALSDVERLLTLVGAQVVDAEVAIGSVHKCFDEDGGISDPELATRVSQLLVKVAEAAEAESSPLKAS